MRLMFAKGERMRYTGEGMVYKGDDYVTWDSEDSNIVNGADTKK